MFLKFAPFGLSLYIIVFTRSWRRLASAEIPNYSFIVNFLQICSAWMDGDMKSLLPISCIVMITQNVVDFNQTDNLGH